MAEYTVTVQSAQGITIRFVISADNAGTALQVAAARERELTQAKKFIKRPS
tara:strand:- start:1797 stop:1949 length:153 start_codon:yes stop_codon:yes gene_type:complete